jgi:hypothetical protein
VRTKGGVTRVTTVTSFSITSPNARAREAINGKRHHNRHACHGSDFFPLRGREIKQTRARRKNESGMTATVWRIRPQLSKGGD